MLTSMSTAMFFTILLTIFAVCETVDALKDWKRV